MLGFVTTMSRREVEWPTVDVGRILAREWGRFVGAVPVRLLHLRLVDAYVRRHTAFLAEDQLLRDAAKLAGIPGMLVHGRYDVSGPLESAWRLNQRWRTSELHLLEDAGHGGGGDAFYPTVVGALNRLAVP